MTTSSTKLVARVVAIRILQRLQRPNTFIATELKREFARYPEADPRDRALATELVYGVLRQRRRLDHSLEPLVKQRLRKLEDAALLLLRLGAYQILFLDRIPKPICVSATQDAARELRMDRLTGLLNAVLRRVGPESERLPQGDSHRAIGVRASLPNWIVAELAKSYGEEACEAEAMALRERAKTSIRPNLVRGSVESVMEALAAEGFSTVPGPEGSLLLSGPGDPFSTQAFRDGAFVPQDPSSLAVVAAMGDVQGKSILDLCSGRGIKATLLAARGANVTCVDVVDSKLAQSKELAVRLGVSERMRHILADATDPGLSLGLFDQVLVDAPCTGLGTIRRHPEIAWRRKPDDLTRLAKIQSELVAVGATHLKSHGILTYAVCTFSRIEGSPAVPSGLVSEGRSIKTRPSEGWDAFQLTQWRRRS